MPYTRADLEARAASAFESGDTATYTKIAAALGYDPLHVGNAGAPFGTRMALSVSQTPVQAADIVSRVGETRVLPDGTRVFKDPAGSWQRVNPQGLDVGDLADVGQMAANVAGGILGGAVGALAAPESLGATIPAGGALGATLGDTAWTGLVRKFTNVPELRSVPEQLVDTGRVLAENAAGEVLGIGAGKALPYLLADAGSAARIAAADRAGVTPTAGQIGGPAVRATERGLEAFATSEPIIRGARERSAASMADAVSRETPNAPADAQGAGELLQTAFGRHVDEFKAAAAAHYDAVPIAPHTPMSTSNFTRELQSLKLSDEALDNAIAPTLRRKLETAVGDVHTYSDLRRLRSQIGEALSGGAPIGDMSTGELKRLYGALSRDIEQGASAAGTGAQNALRAADDFYKAGIEHLDAIDWIRKSATPEAAWRRLTSSTAKGSSVLEAVAPILRQDELAALGQLRLKEMAHAAPGAQNAAGDLVSPARLVTEANRTAPAARGFLPAATDDLVQLGGAMKESQLGSNWSGTARGVSSLAGIGGAVTGHAPAAIGVAVAAPTIAAFIESRAGRALIASAARRLGRDLTAAEIAQLAATGLVGARAMLQPDD